MKPERAESDAGAELARLEEATAWLDSAPALSSTSKDVLDLALASSPYALADRLADRAVKIWFDGATIEPIEPMDIGVEGRMDLDTVMAHGSWEGGVKAPREQRRDEYPSSLEEQMRVCERPFVLRNLSRVVRDADPDAALPLNSEVFELPKLDEATKEIHALLHYRPPQLLDEMNIDVVRGEVAWRRFMLWEMVWADYFSAEVREHYRGGMWKRTAAVLEAERLADEQGSDG